MEKLQQDSDKSLEEHQKSLIGALAEAMSGLDGGPAAAAPEGGTAPDTMVSEVMMAASGIGAAASVAVTVHEDLTASKPSGSIFLNTPRKHQNSLFVGGGQVNPKASRRSTLVPMSYGDKKAMAKVDKKTAPRPMAGAVQQGGVRVSIRGRDTDIFARTRLSGMSLTGASLTGAKPMPIRGVTASAAAAKAVRLKEMKAEMAFLKRIMNNPYENSVKRLVADYRNGVDVAEQTVQTAKPEVLKSAAPQVMAELQMKPPSGAPPR